MWCPITKCMNKFEDNLMVARWWLRRVLSYMQWLDVFFVRKVKVRTFIDKRKLAILSKGKCFLLMCMAFFYFYKSYLLYKSL